MNVLSLDESNCLRAPPKGNYMIQGSLLVPVRKPYIKCELSEMTAHVNSHVGSVFTFLRFAT